MLCAKQIFWIFFFVFCFGDKRHTQRERRTHRKQTWLWPIRLCRRHSCSLWRKSGRRRPGPRRADCWPGPPRQSGLRPFSIKAGNRDPEPLLPVCKSRASHFFVFFCFKFSRNFFVCLNGGGSGQGGSFEAGMDFTGSDRECERDTHTKRETKKRTPKIIKMKNLLVFFLLLLKFSA